MQTVSDKRTEKRATCSIEIEYSYISIVNGSPCRGPWRNLTSDISHSGMGIYSEHTAEIGQEIRIFLRHIFVEPVTARVMWCRLLSPNLYRIGIKYNRPPKV